MSCPKILITDPVDSVCANYLQKHGFHVDQIKLTKEELLENVKVKKIRKSKQYRRSVQDA